MAQDKKQSPDQDKDTESVSEPSTQTTDQGYEIPVPERDDVLGALTRVARPPSDAGGPEDEA